MRNHFGFDSEVCPKGARLKQRMQYRAKSTSVSEKQTTKVDLGKNYPKSRIQGGILLLEILPEANCNDSRDELGAMAGGITLIPERKAYETQR